MIVEGAISVNVTRGIPHIDSVQQASLWQNRQMSSTDHIDLSELLPLPHPTWWQRSIQRLTAQRWAARFMTTRLQRWDMWVHRLSHGRWTASELLTGLPVIFIRTAGARTGSPRITPLLGIEHEGAFLVVATKFGANHHPDWYFNLKANPRVEVTFRGKHMSCQALELAGVQRDAGWTRAVKQYPGYRAYEQRADGRRIPVLILQPTSSLDSSTNA